MHIPKIFVDGIRIPGGPLEGSLALPCPCGEPSGFDCGRDLYITKGEDGYLVIYHDGCIINPGSGGGIDA